MEKHELSAVDFKLIDDAFNALLQSNPEPATANKIKDLRSMFHDAYNAANIAKLPELFAEVILASIRHCGGRKQCGTK